MLMSKIDKIVNLLNAAKQQVVNLIKGQKMMKPCPVRIRARYLVIATCLLPTLLAGPIMASELNVPSVEYSTIQNAIDAAATGDTVIVATGIYNERINFNGKGITVTSSNPASSAIVNTTIIDGQAGGSVVSFVTGEGMNSVFQGFTVRNGSAVSGGGIICMNASPTIQNCVITGNKSTSTENNAAGGGIYCEGSSAKILNNVIVGNDITTFGQGGGGVYLKNSPVEFTNNTVSGNRSKTSPCGIAVDNTTGLTIKNCTIWENGPYREISIIGAGSVTVSYCDVKGGQSWVYVDPGCKLNWGPGNLDNDPLFANPGSWDAFGTVWTNGDYHLKSQAGRFVPDSGWVTTDTVTSLCIDGGDPLSDYSLEPLPNDGRINIGAYGNTPEASKTFRDLKITGRVKTMSGTGISGITILGDNSGGLSTTDADGNYEVRVPSGWSGTVTPNSALYTFNPASFSFTTPLNANQANQDFTGVPRVKSIQINGLSQVDENSFSQYSCTVVLTDNTSVDVTSLVSWSVTGSSAAGIDASGKLTTGEVDADQTCTIKASYSGASVEKTVTIKNISGDTPTPTPTSTPTPTPPSPSIKSIQINGLAEVDENSSSEYSCTVVFMDNSSVNVTGLVSWSVTGSSAAGMGANGKLTTGEVDADQTCTVKASYDGASVEKTVTIKNIENGNTPTDTPTPTPTDVPSITPTSTLTSTPTPDPETPAGRGGCGSSGLLLVAVTLFGFLALAGYRME